MANFRPLKNYMFFCLDKFIEKYELEPPFLDVGCGVGDLSAYVASKGWHGKAIDSSEVAIQQAILNLKSYSQIKVAKESLFNENGKFKTIFFWDVLEHIKDDKDVLKKISSLLLPGGYLLIAVPSNPDEWRWDDDFYGHYRRYTKKELGDKVILAGLKPIIFWDFTFPVFWAMRRLYTRLFSNKNKKINKNTSTSLSSTVNAWDIPHISRLLNKGNFLWRLIYNVQFSFFKNKLDKGHEMFILVGKPKH